MTIKSSLVRIPIVRRTLLHPNPTPEDVREFWDYMCARHGARVIRKSDSQLMKSVGEVLDLLGVLDKEAFLARYTTVIPVSTDKGIYIPFDLGVPKPDWPLWSQITVCVHEIDHLIQCERAGDLLYGWDYITSTAKRAHYEAQAYRCNMEMEWRYFGRMLVPASLAEKLRNYGCSQTDIQIAEKELSLSIPFIRRGGIVEPASREAVVWLDQRYGWTA